jgi:hypothetical protein
MLRMVILCQYYPFVRYLFKNLYFKYLRNIYKILNLDELKNTMCDYHKTRLIKIHMFMIFLIYDRFNLS